MRSSSLSEALHEQRISDIARQIAHRRREARIVLISGPSSSGKTTFSRRLAIQLLALGLSPFALELDSYFVDREKTPLDDKGQFNFEALEALDLNLLGDHLTRLIAGETVTMPRYDFKAGKQMTGDAVQLSPDQIIILEGIHGLDPKLLPAALIRARLPHLWRGADTAQPRPAQPRLHRRHTPHPAHRAGCT